MINKAMLRLYEVTDLSTFVYVAVFCGYDARQAAEGYTGHCLAYLAIVSESDGRDVDVRGKTLNERFQEKRSPGVIHTIRK